MVFDVNKFDLDSWVQVDSVNQPITLDSVHSGHVSHHRTSTFNDHPDHCLIVLKNVKHGFEVRQLIIISVTVSLRFGVIPSMRRPASKEITSDSVKLGDNEVCF